VKEILGSLKNSYENVTEKPKLSFIIVTKRINTRFFRENRVRTDNPVSGTVVDDVVTLGDRYDFYLISQSVRQGTVSPTSYNIIFDQLQIGPDKFQILTYKMCHLYYNWSGTTRVPAVLQYAQKLAILAGTYLHSGANVNVENSLYFM
jgi:aubergine-like protein